VGELDKGCLGKACNDMTEMHGLPMDASIEGDFHLSWMKMFPNPFMPLSFSYFLFFKNMARGHFPSMVTSGGNITHKHFT
jgi:hypothetical protein